METGSGKAKDERRSRRPGWTRSPASVRAPAVNLQTVESVAVVQSARADERAAEGQAVQALRLRNGHHLRDEILVRSRGHVDRERIEAAVPPRVRPAMAFHEERVLLFIEDRRDDR